MQEPVHQFHLSYKEWRKGLRLARRRDPLQKIRYVAGWVLPALLLYLFCAIAWGTLTHRARTADGLAGMATLATLVIIAFSYRPLRLRQIYNNSWMAQHEQGAAIAFNEEYFVVGLPGHSESRYLWSAIYAVVEDEALVLIYTSKRRFVIVPKHAMPDASWTKLSALVPR